MKLPTDSSIAVMTMTWLSLSWGLELEVELAVAVRWLVRLRVLDKEFILLCWMYRTVLYCAEK